jgi:hypothetical protein
MTDIADAGVDSSATGAAVASTVDKASTTKSPTLASELLYADAGNIQATNVTMEHSGADSITAERVTVDHSDVRSLDANSVQLVNSGAIKVQAERAVVQNGGVVLLQADEVRMVNSKAVVVSAGRISTEGNVQTVVHFGPVEGEIRTVFTPQSAIGFGAGVGFVLLILGGLFRRIFGGSS